MAKKLTKPPIEAPGGPPIRRAAREIFSESSTWAGILSIGAAIITGGVSTLTNPALLTSIGVGTSLILTKEGR